MVKQTSPFYLKFTNYLLLTGLLCALVIFAGDILTPSVVHYCWRFSSCPWRNFLKVINVEGYHPLSLRSYFPLPLSDENDYHPASALLPSPAQPGENINHQDQHKSN